MSFRALLVFIVVLAGCVLLRACGQAGFALSTFQLSDITQASPANETSANITDLPVVSVPANTTTIAELPKVNESSQTNESSANITDLPQTKVSPVNITDLSKPSVPEQVNETLANITALPKSNVSQEVTVSPANITDLPKANVSEPVNVTSSNITALPKANVSSTKIIVPPEVTLPQHLQVSSSNITVPPAATPSNQTSVSIKLRCDKTEKEKEITAGVEKEEPRMTLTVNGSVIFTKENETKTIQLPIPRQTQMVKEESAKGQITEAAK